jgi:ribosomal protein S18 acetylase RimI-like enzyme
MATVRQGVLDSVEILDLRHYNSADLRPLLRREAATWAERMSWDYQSSAEMILRYVDSKILPGYAAVDHNRVVGYAFFVYEGSKGVIGDLFTDAGSQARDVAVRNRLLAHVIETLQETPGLQRIEAQLLVHDTGELSPAFLGESFRQHQRLFMAQALHGPSPVLPTALADIHVRRWSEADFQHAAHLITAAYANHIDSHINDQYRSVTGSMRFLNNIVRFPGCGVFDHGASYVAFSRLTGAMIGLVLCSRVRTDVAHVTQICLLPEFRGRGIGQLLMAEAGRELRRRNFTELSLTVTQANTSAVKLYRHLGFKIKRVFDAFVWEG